MDVLGSSQTTAEAVSSWVVCWQQVRSYTSFCEEIEKAKRAAVDSRKKLASETKDNRRLWSSLSLSPSVSTGPPVSPAAAANGGAAAAPDEQQQEQQQEQQGGAAALETVKKATEQLLRGYQQEIDSLTKRAKTAEATFLGLLQLLLQQPDLMVILRDLEASAASGAAGRQVEELKKQIDLQKTAAEELAERNAELEKECHELEEEISRARDQSVTVRMLEQQLHQQQQNFQQQLEAVVAKGEQMAQLKRADSHLQRENAEMAQQLQTAQQQIARLEGRLLQQQQQFVATRDELERKCGAILSEVEMLEEKRLKHENDRQTQSSSSDASTLKALQTAQERISQLLAAEKGLEAEIRKEQQLRMDAEKAHAAAAAQAAKKAEEMSLRVKQLETELRARPTADEVRELRSHLQAASSTLSAKEAEAQRACESLLEDKRRLAAELAAAHQAAAAAKEAAAAANATLAALNVTEHAHHVAPAKQSSGSSLLEHETWGPTAGIQGSPEHEGQKAEPKGVGEGVFKIVVEQRELYKNKLMETEKERDRWRSVALEEKERREALAVENYQLGQALEAGGGGPEEAPWRPAGSSTSGGIRGYAVDILEDSDREVISEETDKSGPLPLVTRRESDGKGRGPRKRRGPSAFVRGVAAVADSVARAAADTARSILGPKDRSTCDSRGGSGPNLLVLEGPKDGLSRRERLKQQQQQQLQQQLQQLGVGERVVVIWGRMLLSSRATRVFALLYFSLLHSLVFLVLLFAADWASNTGSGGASSTTHAYLN